MTVANFSQLQVIGAQVPRWVPRESVRELPPVQPAVGYREYLLNLTRMVDQDDEPAEILRHRKWLTCLRFAEGRQLGYINSRTGLWTDVVREDGDPIYISNVLGYFINALVTEYSRSQIVYDVDSISTALERVGAARLAGEALQYIRRDTWRATEQLREGKFTIICGNSFRRTRLTKNPRIKIPVPHFEERMIGIGGGSYQCTNPECFQLGDVEELQSSGQGYACPQCGHDAPTIHDGLQVPMQVASFREEPAVEVKTSVVDPFEVKCHLHARTLAESPYLRWSVMAYERQIKVQFPWAQFESGTRGTPANLGLLYQREMERSPGNIASQIDLAQGAAGSFDGLTEFNCYWFEPWYYADYVFPEDTMMGDGEVVTAGTKLVQTHPNGLALAKVHNTIVNVWEESKGDQWGHQRWDMMPDQFWAHGIEDMIQSAKQRNEIKSLLYEILLKHAAPKKYYNPLKLRRADIQSRPGWAVPLKNASAQDNPANYVFTEEERAGGPELQAFLEQTNRDMQLEGGGAFSPQPGMPDSDNPTARGKIIMRDAAVQMMIPKLQLKAETEIGTAIQTLRLVHRYELMDYYAGRGAEYAQYELQAFKELNPDRDLIVTARAGSEMPVSEDDRRNDLELALTMGQLPGGIFNPAIPPEIRKLAMERLNLPLETDHTSPDERKQQMEIRRLIVWAQEAEKAGLDIEQAAMIALAGVDGQSPIAPVMFMVDDHEVHVNRIVRYFLTDAGMQASPLLQRLLMDHMQQHLQGEVMKQQQMGVLAVAAQAPAVAAGAQVQGQAMEAAGQGPAQGGQKGAQKGNRGTSGRDQNATMGTKVSRGGSLRS